jgi:hypothetical protein
MTEGGSSMTEGGSSMTEGGSSMTEGGPSMTEGGPSMTESERANAECLPESIVSGLAAVAHRAKSRRRRRGDQRPLPAAREVSFCHLFR